MKCFSRLSATIMLLAGVLSPGAQQTQSSSQHIAAPSPELSAPQLEEEGDALRAQKNYLDAMDYYRAGLKKSNNAVLHNKLGVCWIQQARYSEAKKRIRAGRQTGQALCRSAQQPGRGLSSAKAVRGRDQRVQTRHQTQGR